jgi:PAS domain S-box-containing protein
MQYGFALHEIICNEAGQPVDYRFLEINPAYETLTGLKANELIGRTVLDVLPGTEAYWIERYGRVAQTGEPVQFSNYAQELGKYYEVTAYCPKPGQFGVIFMDVTERKRAEETLRESEHRFHSLFDNMLNGFAYCKMIFDHERPQDFVYLEVNQAFGTLTGLKNVTGSRVSKVIPGIREADPELLETYGRVSLTGIPETFENYVEPLKMWFSISVYSPEKEYFVAVFDVITERKLAEEALNAASLYNRSLIEASLDPLVTISTGGKITDVNEATVKVTGVGREALIGTDFSDYFTEPEKARAGYREVFEKGFVTDFPLTILDKDGRLTDVLYNATLYRDEKGKIVGVFATARDITERKQAEDELRKAHGELELQVQQRTAALFQANMLLQTLLDNMPDQIYFKDSQSRFIKNSRAQAKSMGVSDPSQVIGKTDFDFFPHAQRSYDEEQEIIRSGKPLVDFEEWVVWPDGHGTWVSTSKVPLRDPEDKIIGTFGISRDITDRKRNEDALRRANEELEAFSYSVSHDLRAPLRGIDGWSMALLEDYGDKLDEQGKEFIKRVRSETQHMGSLIDDLLKLSRITRAEMNTQKVDLSAIARSIAARLQENEPQRHVEFLIQKGLSVKGDAHLLDIALTNLLDNAFKFTGKLSIAKIEFGQNKIDKQRVFFVRDNGAGFDMAFAKKLFGAFQRMHTASEFPGTGIGLTTVQRIIHRHGGQVWAESVVNEGTTFFFTLEEKI